MNLTAKKFTQADHTDLICMGKYHCMADLLFDWFEFDQTSVAATNSK